MHLAADNVLRASMELGGNAPLIVFDDSDLESRERRLRGQDVQHRPVLYRGEPIYVQDGIAEAFIEGLTEKVSAVVMGDGLADSVTLGPLRRGVGCRQVGPRPTARATHGRVHDLRAWSATKAAQHGATVKELQARLGRTTPAMALKYQRAEAIRDHAPAAK